MIHWPIPGYVYAINNYNSMYIICMDITYEQIQE